MNLHQTENTTPAGLGLVERALVFAARAHRQQIRKGTDVPYITHPVWVAILLLRAGFEDEIVAAGLLHDTLEDTAVTADDLRQAFGQRITLIVQGASEPDKTPTWEVRKQHTIDTVAAATWEVRAVVCADKLANLGELRAEHAALGEGVWARFNRGRGAQAWYYHGLLRALEAAPPCPRLASLLARLRAEVKALFGATAPTAPPVEPANPTSKPPTHATPMILDLSTLYAATEQAKLMDLPKYETAVLAQVPPGADVTLTGKAPVWLYLKIAHALHGRVRMLSYDSPVTGLVEIFNHNPR